MKIRRFIILFVSFFTITGILYAQKADSESVARLYIASFGRAPDSAGLDYWVDKSGLSLEGIAESFFEQPEMKETYPDSSDTEGFITSVYRNLFLRDPDSAGLDYWKRELENRNISRDNFILAVINGALADTGDAGDRDILNDRTEVGLYFADAGLDDKTLAQRVISYIKRGGEGTEEAKSEIQSYISLPGYPLPVHKEGISDRNNNTLRDARYRKLADDIGVSIQKYNYYWMTFEDSVTSSDKPLKCPAGYTLFPSDSTQKESLGVKRYHCYKDSTVSGWEKRFSFNSKYKIDIAVVLWTTPEQYRAVGCEGFYFPLQDKYLKNGCYPTKEHYDDYEDWIRFTAWKFGKYIDHYIVWNEVDSTDWADPSDENYSKASMISDMSSAMKRSFQIYSSLLKRTTESVSELDRKCMGRENECNNFIYISMSWDWYSEKPFYWKDSKGGYHIIFQNRNLLDYLWKNIGTDINWSVAVHPYGDAYDSSDTSLRFSTLKDFSAYQKKHIEKYIESGKSWLNYTQSRLFASEQNAGPELEGGDMRKKAEFICQTYDIGMRMPELVAMTHNHFQDSTNQDSCTPSKYAMLPSCAGKDLEDAGSYETYQAYISTSDNVWGKSDEHYCCQEFGVGCRE